MGGYDVSVQAAGVNVDACAASGTPSPSAASAIPVAALTTVPLRAMIPPTKTMTDTKLYQQSPMITIV